MQVDFVTTDSFREFCLQNQIFEQISLVTDNFSANLENIQIQKLKNILQKTTVDEDKQKHIVDIFNLENKFLAHNDMSYIRGQKVAKRALEIAASGGHNVLFIGQPGSGKTLLARSYSSILPKMTEAEILEVTQIYSVAGLLKPQEVILTRPFRSPHHSSSHVALVGGGTKLKPGEISLAHRGVLFLDEFAEFDRESIEALRQPLEDGFVTISRASGSVTYPSRFYLLAAANPTPSGFDPLDPDGLNKPQNKAANARYQAKFSGPILDRVDLQVEVNRPSKQELQGQRDGDTSLQILQRVQKARDLQTARFKNQRIQTNSEMSLQLVERFCKLDSVTKELLDKAIDKYKLSARSYIRLLKLSRTIADLASREDVSVQDVAESLQYRGRWS
jgi:magnesium chelatase family protein